MRKLFIALAKLIGLLQLYWASITFLQLASAFTTMLGYSGHSYPGSYLGVYAGMILYPAVSLGMVWLLLMRTEWLADRLNLKADDDSGGIREGDLFRAGVKLIGVYVMVHALPLLVRNVMEQSAYAGMGGRSAWVKLLIPAMQVALGLFLAIRTGRVMDLLGRAEREESRRIVFYGLVSLVALIALGYLLSIGWVYREAEASFRRQCAKEDPVAGADETNTATEAHWKVTAGTLP